MKAFTEANKSAVHSSYAASYQIVKQKKTHAIGESMLFAVAKEL